MGSELQKPWRELEHRPSPQFLDGFRGVSKPVRGASEDLCPLTLDPGALFGGKALGVVAGSPSRNGYSDTSVGSYPDNIAAGRGMADEIHERINIVLRHGS